MSTASSAYPTGSLAPWKRPSVASKDLENARISSSDCFSKSMGRLKPWRTLYPVFVIHLCSLNSIYTLPGGHATQFIQPGPWSYTDRIIVSSCRVTNNAKRPRLDGALPEVAYAPAPTAAPDQSGLCGAVARPAPWGTVVLGRTRRACRLRADDALPLAGRVASVHLPRPGGRVDTLKRAGRVTGAAAAGGRAPGETVAAEAA